MPLCDLLVHGKQSNNFAFCFQTLITVIAYLKQVKISDVAVLESDQEKIVRVLAEQSLKVMSGCNSETIGVPVEALTAIAKIDKN